MKPEDEGLVAKLRQLEIVMERDMPLMHANRQTQVQRILQLMPVDFEASLIVKQRGIRKSSSGSLKLGLVM
jgi:hypothetical protein